MVHIPLYLASLKDALSDIRAGSPTRRLNTTDSMTVAMAGVCVALVILLWIVFTRKKRKVRQRGELTEEPIRRVRDSDEEGGQRRRRRRAHRPRNPTLQQTGGLPPPRPDDQPPPPTAY